MESTTVSISLKASLIFIGIYVVLANAGTVLSAQIDIAYSGQIVLLLVLSITLIIYLRKHMMTEVIGLTKVGCAYIKGSLLYIPLALIILANGVFFFDTEKNLFESFMIVVFMALVAFLEEALFRGLLFKAIERRKSTNMAIIISGLTFGFGHIVNLLGGYTGISQLIQIVLAVVIGFVLAVLFVRTKSIVPGIIFHFLFNTASALSTEVEPMYDYISVGVIITVAGLYLAYLLLGKRKTEHSGKTML